MLIKRVKMNHFRINIIQNWFKPIYIKEIQIFLKFNNFYKRFIYNDSKIITLIIKLIKVIKFV